MQLRMDPRFDRILLSLKKRIIVPFVIVLAIGTWVILCHAHYKSYWYGTIYRVQTTDFNLLHHALPQTLSRMIIEGRSDLVQKTLDSTFGLFGLVITDPSGETILWKTNKVYHAKSWHDKAVPELLKDVNEPYDLLTSPVELEPIYEHPSPRSMKARQLSAPKGMVLGRLYYLRADPPPFWQDVTNFAAGIWELSGAKRGYLYVTISTIAFALVILLVIWLRQRGLELRQTEMQHIQKELDIRKKALEHLTQELAAQKTRKVWLEKEADEAYRRALGLKKSLERLRDSLMGVPSEEIVDGSTSGFKVRPPVHPPSALLEEIESLLPGLSENASVLRHQAGVLSEYCSNLEKRQDEMQRIVDNAYSQALGLMEKNAAAAAAPAPNGGNGTPTNGANGPPQNWIDMRPPS